MRRPHGFTLIELMVGMVIGLLTTLVITQVLAVAEEQRRTTTVGSSAQVNGALALYALQHDLQMTGYGIAVVPPALGCPIRANFGQSGAYVAPTAPTGTPPATPTTLAPITIYDGGTDGTGSGLTYKSDTIALLSGNKTSASLPVVVTEAHPSSATTYVVQSTFGISVGDLMLAVPGPTTSAGWSATNWCTLFRATSITTVAPIAVGNAADTGWNNNQSQITPSAGYTGDGTTISSYLLNLGSMVYRTYSLCTASSTPACNSTLLRSTDLNIATGASTTNDAYADIVNIQAMYGIDTDADGVVNSYTSTAPTTNAGWLQVISLRLAVVARSSVRERDVVTSDAPVWNVLLNATDTTTTAYKLYVKSSATDTDWTYYRYKVYDTVVPLRNLKWNS